MEIWFIHLSDDAWLLWLTYVKHKCCTWHPCIYTHIPISKRCVIDVYSWFFSMSTVSRVPMHSSVHGVSMSSSISDPRFRFRWRAIAVTTLLALTMLVYLYQTSSSSTDGKESGQRRDVSAAEVVLYSSTLSHHLSDFNFSTFERQIAS